MMDSKERRGNAPDTSRAEPGLFTPVELRVRRQDYYLFMLPRMGAKRARELAMDYVVWLSQDPSRIPAQDRPLVAALPNLPSGRKTGV